MGDQPHQNDEFFQAWESSKAAFVDNNLGVKRPRMDYGPGSAPHEPTSSRPSSLTSSELSVAAARIQELKSRFSSLQQKLAYHQSRASEVAEGMDRVQQEINIWTKALVTAKNAAEQQKQQQQLAAAAKTYNPYHSSAFLPPSLSSPPQTLLPAQSVPQPSAPPTNRQQQHASPAAYPATGAGREKTDSLHDLLTMMRTKMAGHPAQKPQQVQQPHFPPSAFSNASSNSVLNLLQLAVNSGAPGDGPSPKASNATSVFNLLQAAASAAGDKSPHAGHADVLHQLSDRLLELAGAAPGPNPQQYQQYQGMECIPEHVQGRQGDTARDGSASPRVGKGESAGGPVTAPTTEGVVASHPAQDSAGITPVSTNEEGAKKMNESK